MAAVTVGTTEIQVAAAAARSIIVQNLGTDAIYVGVASGVTTATGVQIGSGGHLLIDSAPNGLDDGLWLISGAAGQDVRVEVIG